MTHASVDPALRPKSFAEFDGQAEVAGRLRTLVTAAKRRGEVPGHILLTGPPGLGKTTLAGIVAAESGGHLTAASGPVLTKPDEVGRFVAIQPDPCVLFIDEVHRMPGPAQDVLLSALEDQTVTFRMKLPRAAEQRICVRLLPFTLIAATTRPAMLSKPFRDRFAVHYHLDFYSVEQLGRIVERSAGLLGFGLGEGAAEEIARRARGTPRIANQLLRRVRDYAQGHMGEDSASAGIAADALNREGVDFAGLESLDLRYLTVIRDRFKGGPAGLDAVAATLSDDAGTLEDVVEPYLLWAGYITRTAQGRVLTERALRHLKGDTNKA